MYLAKVSANGQITVPAAVRRVLRLDPGDQVLFIQKPDGEIVISKAAASAMTLAQHMSGQVAQAEKDPIQLLIEELRGDGATS